MGIVVMHTEAGRVTRRCRDETLEDGRVSRSQSAEETSGAPAFRLTHGSLGSNPLCFRLLIQERNLTSRTCNRVASAASSLTIPPSIGKRRTYAWHHSRKLRRYRHYTEQSTQPQQRPTPLSTPSTGWADELSMASYSHSIVRKDPSQFRGALERACDEWRPSVITRTYTA